MFKEQQKSNDKLYAMQYSISWHLAGFTSPFLPYIISRPFLIKDLPPDQIIYKDADQ